ncbi:MAG TPA: type II secretion system protein [Candidatus Paceibacterota bacterium]
MNNSKGFTLIELLVVIAVIGILASVVLASLNSARAKSKQAAAKAQLKEMYTHAAIYYDTTGGGSFSNLLSDVTMLGMYNKVIATLDNETNRGNGYTADGYYFAIRGKTNCLCVSDKSGLIEYPQGGTVTAGYCALTPAESLPCK